MSLQTVNRPPDARSYVVYENEKEKVIACWHELAHVLATYPNGVTSIIICPLCETTWTYYPDTTIYIGVPTQIVVPKPKDDPPEGGHHFSDSDSEIEETGNRNSDGRLWLAEWSADVRRRHEHEWVHCANCDSRSYCRRLGHCTLYGSLVPPED